jgi:1-acyl-sn-glycerol-3-phosphate acyltransferase
VRALLRALWGLYCWAVFGLVILAAALAALLLPTLRLRRIGSSRLARFLFRAIALPFDVVGRERLPAEPSVVVANHGSYLDGPLMFAALPSRFGFVIKKEVLGIPLAGLALRRLGHEFVDRFDQVGRTRDVRRILKAAVDGVSVAFFPEGTFDEKPGLARFHRGAFVMAIRAGMPVVPIVIHGARAALPAGRWLPRRVRLVVEILEPLEPPDAGDPDGVNRLLRQARMAMLATLAEPDLEEVVSREP